MHRAAFALAVARAASSDFRHHSFRIRSPRQEDAVAAMMRREGIARFHRESNAARRGFFTNGKVQHRTSRLTANKKLTDTLLENADAEQFFEVMQVRF